MPLDRSSGILLHISSLPSRGGIGDLGTAAYEFADFLQASRQQRWQVLPLGPPGYGDSPYAGLSAFAGNPLLISLEKLAEAGWIARERIDEGRIAGETGSGDGRFDERFHVRFEEVKRWKLPLLVEAARNFLERHAEDQWEQFRQFCRNNAYWLDDYALFLVLRSEFQCGSWRDWPRPAAHRDAQTLRELAEKFQAELETERAIQFAFHHQWCALRRYCAERKIRLIGDLAIFVSDDSADVWTHPEIFDLRPDLLPVHVAGVPPDYFSADGQRWGNPLYRWDVLEREGFSWWVDRMRRAHELYDIIRLDHFRGFEAFWEIPAENPTAVNGRWVKAPGAALFTRLREEFGSLQFIAEDLGVITPEVVALREQFGFPGMRVLQFGVSGPGARIYLPDRYQTNTVVYTGTHDNDTTLGWWTHGASAAERSALQAYLNPGGDGVVWAMIRAASASVADLCLFPAQDVLGLGSEARMNTPSKAEGNWGWRVAPGAFTAEMADRLATLAEVTDRTGDEPES